FDPAYIYGGAIGYSFGNLATELELDHSSSKLTSVAGVDVTSASTYGQTLKFEQTTLIANAIYKTPLAESVSLNLSGGLGAQFHKTNLNQSVYLQRKSDTAFVGQLSPSVSFNLSKNVSLTAGYKLRFVDEANVATAKIAPYSADVKVSSHWDHVFTVGVGYSF
ncbi:MAG: outer membrane beta-barrel protein, partial [Verrucomicrobiota bacterium]